MPFDVALGVVGAAEVVGGGVDVVLDPDDAVVVDELGEGSEPPLQPATTPPAMVIDSSATTIRGGAPVN